MGHVLVAGVVVGAGVEGVADGALARARRGACKRPGPCGVVSGSGGSIGGSWVRSGSTMTHCTRLGGAGRAR